MNKEIFDCVIVGAGPAGLGATFYAARDRFKTLVLEKFYPGRQINNTDRIENYLGFENISGPDLIEKMMGQVSSVFDFAHRLLLVELENGIEKERKEIELAEQSGLKRADNLGQPGVGVLICEQFPGHWQI